MAEEKADIKVHRIGKPLEVRFFTKTAWDYIKTGSKWVLADDQTPEPAKKKDVSPVAKTDVEDKKPGLRAEYLKITGKESDPVWNEARLFIEIEKAKKVQPEPAAAEVPEPEAPKKRGRKPKATA